jgi:DNA-binding GntR family transcriptional regulator
MAYHANRRRDPTLIQTNVTHAHLIDLIEVGDGDALERAMRDHLTEIEEQVVLEEFQPRTVDLKSALRAGRPGRKRRSGS